MIDSNTFKHGTSSSDKILKSAHHKLSLFFKEYEKEEYLDTPLLEFLNQLKNYHKLDSIGKGYIDVIEFINSDITYVSAWVEISSRLFATLTSAEIRALRKQILNAIFNTHTNPICDEWPWFYRDTWASSYWAGYLLSKSIFFKPILTFATRLKINQLLKKNPVFIVVFYI